MEEWPPFIRAVMVSIRELRCIVRVDRLAIGKHSVTWLEQIE